MMPTAARNRFNRWLVWALLLVLIATVAALTYSHQPDPIGVRVASATYENIDRSISTMGKVVPVEDFQAHATFPGVVENLYVHLGEKVQPGQKLIQMKDPFASSRVVAATAALQGAQVADDNIQHGGSQEDRINSAGDRAHVEMEQASAAKSLALLKDLQKTGGASTAEVNAATIRLQAAEATLNTMTERSKNRYSSVDRQSFKTRVAEAKASLAAEKVTFANANITSPIAGTVYLVPVSKFDYVQPGADLLHVADLTRLQIRANFDEPDIGKLQENQQATITWEGRPNESWVGHIRHAPLAATMSGSRNVGESMISVDDPRGELLPNTNVVVVVTVEHHTNVLTIPREALHTDGPASFVYRVVAGVLQRTPVEIGIVNLSHAEITRGITPADILALHASDNREMTNHLRVSVLE